MTTNDIITIARRFLQDTASPYHWTDENLRKNLQSAIIALHKERPESRYVNGALVDKVELPDEPEEGEEEAAITIDDRFEEALACYVTHLAYLDDCTDTVSATLAEVFLQKFKAKAQT